MARAIGPVGRLWSEGGGSTVGAVRQTANSSIFTASVDA
jgi:hypothetical protein